MGFAVSHKEGEPLSFSSLDSHSELVGGFLGLPHEDGQLGRAARSVSLCVSCSLWPSSPGVLPLRSWFLLLQDREALEGEVVPEPEAGESVPVRLAFCAWTGRRVLRRCSFPWLFFFL